MDVPGEPRQGEDPAEGLVHEARRLQESAGSRGVPVRVMGGVAVRLRCPGQADLLRRFDRRYVDLDVVGYGRDAKALREVLSGLGYVEDPHVYLDSAGTRMVASLPGATTHLDVFLDDLQFCHTLPMKGRLEQERTTLPLADLVLQKLQIVQINHKDLVDVVALLLEHPVADEDGIDADRIAELTAEDWGLWRTVTLNLEKVRGLLDGAPELTDAERALGRERLQQLDTAIAQRPRSLRWRMRAKVGDRVKWYRDVEDLHEGEGVPRVGSDRAGSGHAAP